MFIIHSQLLWFDLSVHLMSRKLSDKTKHCDICKCYWTLTKSQLWQTFTGSPCFLVNDTKLSCVGVCLIWDSSLYCTIWGTCSQALDKIYDSGGWLNVLVWELLLWCTFIIHVFSIIWWNPRMLPNIYLQTFLTKEMSCNNPIFARYHCHKCTVNFLY